MNSSVSTDNTDGISQHRSKKLSFNPIAVMLDVANGLEFLFKSDPTHILFGRLSSHSIYINPSNQVMLHTRGGTDVPFDETPNENDEPDNHYQTLTNTLNHGSSFESNSSISDSTSYAQSVSADASTILNNIPNEGPYRRRHVRTNRLHQHHKPMHHQFFTSIDGDTDSARWRAPEVAEGKIPTVSSAVFSFGMVLWEVLTQQIPFESDPADIAQEKMMKGERPSLAMISDTSLSMLIDRCWAQDPKRRPSITDVIACLEDLTDINDVECYLAEQDDTTTDESSSTQTLFSTQYN
ncbi:hypothetical protein BLNAU_19816 [Blattamonas nauphoetae]|uniref:Protein kinase domain-containing protein n=1 Tax=Blattamonas nauphoetae TaxID=2049346 RepID=A0ABQ9X0L3_9EUKA|nr:hypothetical protein BLNAU_19816 [Blattamonas nauphoetae]